MKELILGGVRSGKSRLAMQRARATGLDVVYIATAVDAGDAELEERIRQHRRHRPAGWLLAEEPLALGTVLRAHSAPVLPPLLSRAAVPLLFATTPYVRAQGLGAALAQHHTSLDQEV